MSQYFKNLIAERKPRPPAEAKIGAIKLAEVCETTLKKAWDQIRRSSEQSAKLQALVTLALSGCSLENSTLHFLSNSSSRALD